MAKSYTQHVKEFKESWNKEAGMYRVWVHPVSGSDYYYIFKSKKTAMIFYKKAKLSKRFHQVERPIKVGRLE